MRRQHRYHSLLGCILAALSLVCAGGCNENLEPPGWNGPAADVTLHLSTGSTYSRTRAFDPAADGFDEIPADLLATEREEAIHRVDFFFFKSDAAGNRASGSEEDLFYVYEVTNRSDVTTADVTVKLPIELSDKFVQNGSGGDYKAYVYVLVNLPETIKINTGANSTLSFDAIQALEVGGSGFTAVGGPSDFVMRGGAAITMVKNGNTFSASGTILLERLAAKIRLWASVAAGIYIDPETGRSIQRDQFKEGNAGNAEYEAAIAKAEKWIPVTTTVNEKGESESNVGLYIYNVATKGRIDAALPDDPQYADIDRTDANKAAVRKLVEISSSQQETGEAIYEEKFPYTHKLAYYSYPNVWSNSASADNHQTYLILRLPWQRVEEDGDMEFQNFYYQIPVNLLKASEDKAENCLAANHYYRTKIKIGMLGSKDMGDPLEVEASCEVVPWQTADVDVSIKGRRYLVVNQTDWTMNNTWTLEIPFSSSHPVEVEACYVNYFRYNDIWGTDDQTENKNIKEHNAEEYYEWLYAANSQLSDKGGINGEGLLTGVSFDNKEENLLYYKKSYFFDQIYYDQSQNFRSSRQHPYRGFRYYLGHEHPKTVNPALKACPSVSGNEKDAWDLYNETYNKIDAVYTCTVDSIRGVIHFEHPLIQWDEVWTGPGNTGKLKYYVPKLNPRTNKLWDEFSRCEIVIKLKHRDWANKDDLYRETIHITQYPALYVEVSHNYGTLHVDDDTRGNEYIFVNANSTEQELDPDNNYWTRDILSTQWFEVTCTVTYFGNINNNPNMYVIHTSQLSEENEELYDIGDPRTLYYNNILSTKSMTDYVDSNTSNGNTPIRWSDDDMRPWATLVYGNYVKQENDHKTASAWWVTREYMSATGRLFYEYRYYSLCKSIYPDFKPQNSQAEPPVRTDNRGIFGGWTWDYVNHQNNLCYYYPTDESEGPGSKANFIAPAFRVASSLGKVSLNFTKTNDNPNQWYDVSREEARRRCATYQEAGRPAGRWRVPTVAEIKYLVQLSADGKIPHLFGLIDNEENFVPYWSSGGIVGVKLNNGVTEPDVKILGQTEVGMAPAVRCVYDEWYWPQVDGGEFPAELTDGPLTKQFYWGDRPKDNTQVPLPARTRSFFTK